ncbi:MAG: hypothetical protein WA709_01550 [Stellaceae bacterium]
MEQNDHTVAVRELLHEAKILASRYYALTRKPLGVTGEVAELEAAEALNLVLSPPRQPDYDAFRSSNGAVERYQIKGRAVDPTDRYRGRVPAIQYDRNFEWVLLVLLDRSTYSALEIWQASRQNVRARLEAPGSRARNERNSMGITQFVSIARKVWPQQDQAAGTADASTETGWAEEKMTRECAIRHGNQRCTSAAMQGHNTHFSNINTSKDVWWLDIPKRKIEQPSTDALHLLLCDDRLGEQRFYHLQVPISYLQKNIRDFRIRDDTDKIHLELAIAGSNIFQDVIGPGLVRFAQFRHCSFSIPSGS